MKRNTSRITSRAWFTCPVLRFTCGSPAVFCGSPAPCCGSPVVHLWFTCPVLWFTCPVLRFTCGAPVVHLPYFKITNREFQNIESRTVAFSVFPMVFGKLENYMRPNKNFDFQHQNLESQLEVTHFRTDGDDTSPSYDLLLVWMFSRSRTNDE